MSIQPAVTSQSSQEASQIKDNNFSQIASPIGKIAIVILFVVYGIIAAYGAGQGLSGAEPLTFSAKMLYDHYYGLIAFLVLYIAIVANKWAALPANDSKAPKMLISFVGEGSVDENPSSANESLSANSALLSKDPQVQATSTNLTSSIIKEPTSIDEIPPSDSSAIESLSGNFVKSTKSISRKIRQRLLPLSSANALLIASTNRSLSKNTKRKKRAVRTSFESANNTPIIGSGIASDITLNIHSSCSTTTTLRMETIALELKKYSPDEIAIIRSADYPLDYHAENMNSEEVTQMRKRFIKWDQSYRLCEGQMLELLTHNHPKFDCSFILKWFDDKAKCLRYTKIDCQEKDNSKIQEILENAGFKMTETIATLV